MHGNTRRCSAQSVVCTVYLFQRVSLAEVVVPVNHALNHNYERGMTAPVYLPNMLAALVTGRLHEIIRAIPL